MSIPPPHHVHSSFTSSSMFLLCLFLVRLWMFLRHIPPLALLSSLLHYILLLCVYLIRCFFLRHIPPLTPPSILSFLLFLLFSYFSLCNFLPSPIPICSCIFIPSLFFFDLFSFLLLVNNYNFDSPVTVPDLNVRLSSSNLFHSCSQPRYIPPSWPQYCLKCHCPHFNVFS